MNFVVVFLNHWVCPALQKESLRGRTHPGADIRCVQSGNCICSCTLGIQRLGTLVCIVTHVGDVFYSVSLHLKYIHVKCTQHTIHPINHFGEEHTTIL